MADSISTVAEIDAPDEIVEASTAVVDEVLVEDVLVEEVSIDGMCGVY
jgi:mycofactocin precursor